MTSLSPLSSQSPPNTQADRARLAAQRLEAQFISEMLKSSGFGGQVKSFSGGNGEDQFASFHRDAIAQHMVRAGGLGLSEHFFNAMMEAGHDQTDSE